MEFLFVCTVGLFDYMYAIYTIIQCIVIRAKLQSVLETISCNRSVDMTCKYMTSHSVQAQPKYMTSRSIQAQPDLSGAVSLPINIM